MSKVGIIYWSSTGNTEAMAQAVEEGAKAAGADVEIMEVADADVDKALSFDVLALGCPAMGDEELEEGEFEPFFSELEGKLSGKRVALFGSYDWGDGEWMRTWCGRAKDAGAELVEDEGVICNNTPATLTCVLTRAVSKAFSLQDFSSIWRILLDDQSIWYQPPAWTSAF